MGHNLIGIEFGDDRGDFFSTTEVCLTLKFPCEPGPTFLRKRAKEGPTYPRKSKIARYFAESLQAINCLSLPKSYHVYYNIRWLFSCTHN